MHRQSMASSGDPPCSNNNIKVYVRQRPLLLPAEATHRAVIEMRTESKSVVISKMERAGGATLKSEQGQTHEYKFDGVFDESESQERVYQLTTKPCIEDVLVHGVNATILAYGATNAGKTYTMNGTKSNPGLIPRAIDDLFAKIKSLSARKKRTFTVRVSYMEIYNETIKDLLTNSDKSLSACEVSGDGEVKVLGLTERVAASAEEISRVIADGSARRKTHQTGANETSSRSHAVLTIEIDRTVGEGGSKPLAATRLFLIDLAGSERAAATNNQGIRLREGASINRSLLALANAINALSQGERAKYRDSKLTLVLKKSLEGESRVVIIAAVSPSHKCYEESHNTLKYASRAKSIKPSICSVPAPPAAAAADRPRAHHHHQPSHHHQQ